MADKFYEIGGGKNKEAEVAGIRAVSSAVNTLFEAGGDSLKELIRTAQTNPLIGIFLAYLLTDVCSDVKISGNPLLHPDSVIALKVIIAAGAGFSLATEVATAISDFTDLVGNRAAAPNIVTPTATTLVNADRETAHFADLGATYQNKG